MQSAACARGALSDPHSVIIQSNLFDTRTTLHQTFRMDKCKTIVVAERQQHTLTLYPTEHTRSEIHDVGTLFTDQIFRLFPLCDAGDDRASTSASRRIAEIYGAFDELVRIWNHPRRDNSADADIELCKIVVRDFWHTGIVLHS